MSWRYWIGALIALAIIAGVAAFANIDADAQDMDPSLLEAYAALERPSDDALEQGREWSRRGDTGTLYRPAAWVMQSCGDPLGCIMFTPGISRTRAFCTMVLPRELPEFMAEAVADVRLAECGAVLTVANN